MAKLTPAKINTVAAVVVAGVTAGQKVWKALNENESVNQQVKNLTAKVKDATHADPALRLTQQLDAIAEAIAALPADHPRAPEWAARVEVLRAKLPLLKAQAGTSRRATLKALRHRTTTLLAEVIGDGIIDPPVVSNQPKPRPRLRQALLGRRQRSEG